MGKLKQKIIFTGGGSAGHVTVNLALIPRFKQIGWDVAYIGSRDGIEKQLVGNLDDVPYFAVATGKLRRYFDWNNFKDPFKVMKGIFQAYRIIKREKPAVIFSKGGFVSVPVVIGARLNKVPTIIHESDLTPGLANKLSIPFATKVCTTFPETAKHLKGDKVVHVGAVVRDELKQGNALRGFTYCGFTKTKPVILIMGGSLGSQRINETVRANLSTLLSEFQIVHICGKGQVDPSIEERHYKQFEYVSEELPNLMAMADFVISRAGSNAIFEFLALRKPMLLIPLSRAASRGDQILNAKSFADAGYAEVLQEEALTDESFVAAVRRVYENRAQITRQMEQKEGEEAIDKVIALLEESAK